MNSQRVSELSHDRAAQQTKLAHLCRMSDLLHQRGLLSVFTPVIAWAWVHVSLSSMGFSCDIMVVSINRNLTSRYQILDIVEMLRHYAVDKTLKGPLNMTVWFLTKKRMQKAVVNGDLRLARHSSGLLLVPRIQLLVAWLVLVAALSRHHQWSWPRRRWRQFRLDGPARSRSRFSPSSLRFMSFMSSLWALGLVTVLGGVAEVRRRIEEGV